MSDGGVDRVRPFDGPRFRAAVREMIEAAGFDVDPVHLAHTDTRVTEMWQRRLLGGYDASLAEVLGGGFEEAHSDLVVVKDIAVHGVCPHHLVPWHGVAHVGYLPGGCLHGFGRIALLADVLCNRLTYQEWATRGLADALVEHGNAKGAACVIRAQQMCLTLGESRRGMEQVSTSAFVGCLERQPELRAEFLEVTADR